MNLTITEPTSFGLTGGVGMDFRISDNLALFWQAGINGTKPEDVVGLTAIFSQAGVYINLFKSKTL